MKMSEFKQTNDFIYEIPKEEDVLLRLVSKEFEFLGRHWDKANRIYVPCIGAKNNCEFCCEVQDKPIARYIGYIVDGAGDLKLAALPYSVIAEINTIGKVNDLIKDDIPQFFVRIFKSGKGLDTIYNVEKDVEDQTEIDLTNKQTPKEYVESLKNEVKGVEKPVEEVKTETNPDKVMPF